MGAEGSANNSVLCEDAQQVTGDTIERTTWWTAPVEKYSVAPLQAGVLVLPTSDLSLEPDPGLSTPTTREQTLPW